MLPKEEFKALFKYGAVALLLVLVLLVCDVKYKIDLMFQSQLNNGTLVIQEPTTIMESMRQVLFLNKDK